MLAALAGDESAYRRLLMVIADALRGYFVRRLPRGQGDVEDLVQETLIAVHTKRETYDRSLPFAPWLFAIARYKLVDHVRRRKLRFAVSLDDIGDPPAADEIEPLLAHHDVENLLASLPSGARETVRQIKVDGLSTAEVARQTGRSEVAVRVGLHRALKALSDRLREDNRRADR